MKQILFLFSLLISTLSFSQSEISKELFPTLAGLQRTICNEYCTSSKASLETFDEILFENDKPYIYCHSAFLLREENNQILIYCHSLDKDLVLYDFTLEVGDSLPRLYLDESAEKDLYWINYNIMNVVDYYKDFDGNILPVDTLIVTDVSMTTLLDGKEYKKWTFSNGMEYVEGIGSFGNNNWSGDFFQLIGKMAIPVSLHGTHIVCASRNEQLLYQMDNAEMERLGTKCLCDGIETDLEAITPTITSFRKILQDGQLLILNEDKTYNVMGVEVE